MINMPMPPSSKKMPQTSIWNFSLISNMYRANYDYIEYFQKQNSMLSSILPVPDTNM